MSYYYEKTEWSGIMSPLMYHESMTTLVGPFETKEEAKKAARKARKNVPIETHIGDIVVIDN